MPRKYIRKRLTKTYTAGDLKSAVESVNNGASIRETANEFRIPYTTLNSHVNQFVVYPHPGRPTKFTDEEELCLEESALILQVRDDFVYICMIFLFLSL